MTHYLSDEFLYNTLNFKLKIFYIETNFGIVDV